MGPTKVIPKGKAVYEVKSGKLVNDGFASRQEMEDYVARHYTVLPVVDNAGNDWLLEGRPIYCLRGSRYETVDDEQLQLSRCPDCGGMGVRSDVPLVESDVIRCVACGNEFDTRLEMMET